MIERQARKQPIFALLLHLTVLAPVLAFVAAAHGQGPQYRSGFGSELVYQCKAYVRMTSGPHSGEDIAAGHQCLGYIEGFVDGVNSEFTLPYTIAPAYRKDHWSKGLCIPPGALDTWIKVYLAFMDKNPTHLDDPKGDSLRIALHDAYPCEK
jgi:hypothetical protein